MSTTPSNNNTEEEDPQWDYESSDDLGKPKAYRSDSSSLDLQQNVPSERSDAVDDELDFARVARGHQKSVKKRKVVTSKTATAPPRRSTLSFDTQSSFYGVGNDQDLARGARGNQKSVSQPRSKGRRKSVTPKLQAAKTGAKKVKTALSYDHSGPHSSSDQQSCMQQLEKQRRHDEEEEEEDTGSVDQSHHSMKAGTRKYVSNDGEDYSDSHSIYQPFNAPLNLYTHKQAFGCRRADASRDITLFGVIHSKDLVIEPSSADILENLPRTMQPYHRTLKYPRAHVKALFEDGHEEVICIDPHIQLIVIYILYLLSRHAFETPTTCLLDDAMNALTTDGCFCSGTATLTGPLCKLIMNDKAFKKQLKRIPSNWKTGMKGKFEKFYPSLKIKASEIVSARIKIRNCILRKVRSAIYNLSMTKQYIII